VKLLLVSFYFPPAGGGGVQRPLKLATHLPATGIEIVSPPNVDTFTLRDGKVTSVQSEMAPGGGFKGMIEQIRAAAAAR